ncbi:pantothenate synthetase [Dongia mobilis]|uniref:Pantothenate synthetase n=1 Tax=Dongia mobilis TaxID=578943 RepID=A0A4R6WYN4_9PROT|nr:pantoate--beta-alanine ligase [Dongia mobilis]TDQ84563.1 pantothenate synthetase [Dongia mobilis]
MSGPAIVHRVADLRAQIHAWRAGGETIGLVPTMGALHDGHLSLVAAARRDNTRTVATIFVNPTQFAPHEDLAAYPRDPAGDAAKLGAASCDLLFAPEIGEMYPDGFATSVAVSGLTRHLCGATRPGHFGGVATIVTKLLLQALPDRAYFGEKDFQQLQVIRRLVRDLDIPVKVVGVPTLREADGLAMSSRNRYLSAEDRTMAAQLPRTLRESAARIASGGEVAPILADAAAALRAAGFTTIDYIELCDAETLQPIAGPAPGARLFVAAWLGRTRLIDNWPVG